MPNNMPVMITDRTESDCAELKALYASAKNGDATAIAQLLTEHKGAYNATDLNRVGEACAFIYNKLVAMGYTVTGYTALKTDWTINDAPTAAQMTTYLATIAALKAVFGTSQTIPTSMNNIDYEDADNIEKLLVAVEHTASGLLRMFIRSNMITAYSGTGFYILNEEEI